MHIRLTPGLQAIVLQFIRAGGYDWVAAEAAGVPRPVFEHWLRRGERSRRRPYREFFLEVSRARAEARLAAELAALKKDARFWLRYGPGRELPDRPGWGNSVPRSVRAGAANDPFASPEFNRLLGELFRCLADFPEARAAAAEALERFDVHPSRRGRAQVKVRPPSPNGDNRAQDPLPPSPNGDNRAQDSLPPSPNGDNGAQDPLPPSPNGDNGAADPLPPSPNGDNGAPDPTPPSPNGDNGAQDPLPPSPNGDNG